ncbi:MAG: PEP-CTERM sorting domain-containing protein [Verrucomicrobiae bacterium]|nr:PEP-CTERM sorting domain-containing protein [Verrucomicrobiae bacterium]
MKKQIFAGWIALGLSGMAGAQEYKVLKTFSGSDGANPYGTVLVDGGKMYGMTSARSTLGFGTVFSMDLNGSNHTILHSFAYPYSATDGAQPQGDLIRVGDTLYGMTLVGGANQPATGSGVVFRVDIDGTDFALLHTFSGSAADGSRPYGSLSYVGGQLYGMTSAGGTSNTGALFRMDTNGGSFSVLHNFSSKLEGEQPFGDLLAIGDRLYGTASAGGTGNVNGAGIVFSIGTNGAGFQVMRDFRGGPGDGNRPMGSLLELDGVLYGTVENGGSNVNRGAVFRINTDGTGYQIIHNFAGGNGDGSDPLYSDLVAFGDSLYGLTQFGGTNNYGTLFELNTNGGDFAVLHSFRGGSADGRYPYGGLEIADGVLYGMTANGGPSDIGTVFSFVIPEPGVWVALALGGALLALRRRR